MWEWAGIEGGGADNERRWRETALARAHSLVCCSIGMWAVSDPVHVNQFPIFRRGFCRQQVLRGAASQWSTVKCFLLFLFFHSLGFIYNSFEFKTPVSSKM